ncbi:MAG: AI-2E family transporter [Candidatus Doudnabacteria bacterium]|nr:AI-2E family transporter [Candidatus Doudnabacteria bacterium]
MINNLEPSTKIIFKVVFVTLALAFLWAVKDIVLLFLLSVILASAMEPMAEYLNQKQRIPRAVSVLAVYIFVFGFTALVIYLLIPPALEQFKILSQNLPEYASEFEQRFGLRFIKGLNLANLFGNFLSQGGENAVFKRTFGVFNGLFSFVTVLVISFYLVAEERGMKNFIATLIPQKHQEFTMGLIEKIQRKMGLWVLGQIILSLVIFALTFIGLTILGVKYALFLALLAGLLEIVPYIGPFVSAVPAIFFVVLKSPPLGLAVAILYLIIQKIEGYVLVPKVMEKTVGTSPLVVLLALLVGFKLAGILGLLIAVPLASAITVVVNELSAIKSQQDQVV